jgi:hypothetical protein
MCVALLEGVISVNSRTDRYSFLVISSQWPVAGYLPRMTLNTRKEIEGEGKEKDRWERKGKDGGEEEEKEGGGAECGREAFRCGRRWRNRGKCRTGVRRTLGAWRRAPSLSPMFAARLACPYIMSFLDACQVRNVLVPAAAFRMAS